MSDTREKRFLTYEKQIELLKAKKLTIEDENKAIEYLKHIAIILLFPVIKIYLKLKKTEITNLMLLFKK